MRALVPAGALALALALCAGAAPAADLGRLVVEPPSHVSGAETSARWFAETHAAELELTRLDLTAGRATVRPHLSQRIVRFEVERRGWPVFFASVVVQVDAEDRIRRAAAHLPESRNSSVEEHPAGCLDDALAWAEGHGLESSAPRAGWLETRDGELAPVVRVDVRREDELYPTSVYLHARAMTVVHAEPLADATEPPGAILVENPVTTPDPFVVSLKHLDDMRYQRLSGAYAHVERCIDIETCEHTAPSAGPDLRGHLIYAPQDEPFAFDDPFAEVNAYHHISNISHWTRQRFGWNGLFDGNTWIWVKVGYAVHNAYFFQGNDDIPPQITFGQDDVDFAYDADVAFHEFGHAINRSMWAHPWYFADRYGMDTSPFGIEEGLADIWAQTHAGDPVMNTYIVRSRTADNDLTCPDDLRAEGHMEARIVSGFGWDVRERVGQLAWDHVVFRTLSFLEAQAAFDDFVQELIVSAEDLAEEGEVAIPEDMTSVLIEEAENRGLLDPECLDRFVPLPEREESLVYGYGRDRTYGHDFPFGIQWKIQAPDDAVAFKIAFDWAYPDDEEPGYRVHLSRGRPVEVSWYPVGDLADGEPAFDVLADVTHASAPTQVSYPVIGLEPLEHGEEVYVLLSGDMDARIVAIRSELFFLPDLPPPPGRPLGGGLRGNQAAASSWSPSCGTGRTGADGASGRGLLAAIATLID